MLARQVWVCRHLPQNRDIFMTGGGNGSVNLYKYSYPAQRVKKDPEVCDPSPVAGAE